MCFTRRAAVVFALFFAAVLAVEDHTQDAVTGDALAAEFVATAPSQATVLTAGMRFADGNPIRTQDASEQTPVAAAPQVQDLHDLIAEINAKGEIMPVLRRHDAVTVDASRGQASFADVQPHIVEARQLMGTAQKTPELVATAPAQVRVPTAGERYGNGNTLRSQDASGQTPVAAAPQVQGGAAPLAIVAAAFAQSVVGALQIAVATPPAEQAQPFYMDVWHAGKSVFNYLYSIFGPIVFFLDNIVVLFVFLTCWCVYGGKLGGSEASQPLSESEELRYAALEEAGIATPDPQPGPTGARGEDFSRRGG